MKNITSAKKLSLNKLTISKLNNTSAILGGAIIVDITDMTGMGSSCRHTGCPPPQHTLVGC